MTEPGDFGLSSGRTLSHVGEPTPAPGHGPFWNKFGEEVWKLTPLLMPVSASDDAAAAASGVTHSVASLGGARVGCRLTEPEGGANWGVVVLHGYHTPVELPPIAPRVWTGAAVLQLRVRGFPGSTADTGHLAAAPGGWIVQGLDAGSGSALRGAVADVVAAFRALRERLGPDAPISIVGESLGGGLAVIAAAQMAVRERVFRLVVGLPSLGDWPWRIGHADRARQIDSLWGDVQRWLDAHPERGAAARELLRYCDAVVHAPRVACPTLAKLALRDGVAPAPTAAAIYNALGTSPGRKWRFVVERGHAPCGGDDLRRHALFERLSAEFVRPETDLVELMSRWSGLMQQGTSPPGPGAHAAAGRMET